MCGIYYAKFGKEQSAQEIAVIVNMEKQVFSCDCSEKCINTAKSLISNEEKDYIKQLMQEPILLIYCYTNSKTGSVIIPTTSVTQFDRNNAITADMAILLH